MDKDNVFAPSPHVGSADASRRSEGICPWCHGPIAIRNPTGACDHLHYPDYLTPTARAYVELDEPRGWSAAEEPCSERVTNIAPYETYDPKGEGK
jgi:hypothetical protein